MKLRRLTIRELTYRKWSTAISVLSIAIASACALGSFGMLSMFDMRTNRIIEQRQADVKRQTDQLKEEYRKIGTKMGFNVLILPKDQNLGDLYANDFASRTMPEWYIDTLARSPIVTIQHLLPMLQQKVTWPEQKRTVIMVGTRGEVPIIGADSKKPLQQTVPCGSVFLGYELHSSLGLTKGKTVKFMGQNLTVTACYPVRGNKDDISMWINLEQAQELLNKKGLINGILALECNCAMANPDMIRAELSKILPGTQVVEFASAALARAEARAKAAAFAESALKAEIVNRSKMRAEKESFFAIIIPLVIILAAALIGLLSYVNVRQRRHEIGILKAIGCRSMQIYLLITGRAAIIGCFGAAVGVSGGLLMLMYKSHGGAAGWLFHGSMCMSMIITLIAAPVLSIGISLIPALLALSEDTADTLRRE